MKKIFLLAAFALSSLCLLQAQSFLLEGELSIYLKNGEVLTGKYKIAGTKIKDPSNISYQDIDSIKQGWKLYEYVKVSKNEVNLLIVKYKSDKLTFYEGRPQDAVHSSPMYIGGKWVGSVPNGEVVTTYNHYMLKEGMDYPIRFIGTSRQNEKLVEKYFSDCPVLMNALKDKKKRENINSFTIFKIYTDGCVDTSNLLNFDADQYLKDALKEQKKKQREEKKEKAELAP